MNVDNLISILKPLQIDVWFIKLGFNRDLPSIGNSWNQYKTVKCTDKKLVIDLTGMIDSENAWAFAHTNRLKQDIEKIIDSNESNCDLHCDVCVMLEDGLFRIYPTTTITVGTNLFLFFGDETKE